MATQTSAVTGLEPRAFWDHFEALYRRSRDRRVQEEPVIEHVRAWSAQRGFELQQDAGRNLVIRPATPGRETAPVVTLQGHLDMVCERDASSPNDPAEGRIVLVREGEWLTADGTTLGADDGVAIAAMMALVEDESLPHGPLELLMTISEEVGLEGANALDPALVTGSFLVTFDSEDRPADGRVRRQHRYRGFASGRRASSRRATRSRSASPSAAAAAATPAIALGRSNAVKVLGRALREARETVPFRLVSFAGGKSRNAIPRDAIAICAVPADQERAFRDAVAAAAATIRDAYIKTDPGIAIDIEPADAQELPWTDEGTKTLLDAVALVPTGPLALSPDFDDLVETSTSLGEAITEGDELTLHSLSRSSNDSAMPEVIATLDAAARLGGGELEVKKNYGGWRPDLDSKALAAARGAYEREFGEPPIITAVHAGLETAVIGTKVPGLDMLSFGPQIEFPHSPDERVSIPTVERFWKLLVVFLDEMSEPRK